ncbi:hypothetical protein KKJ17_14865 [Xenorhabdus bovienii]|uniref:hypothetical protein n=1 Tax=Xenorhabdus bovienii TaxID=40576 RepID=UPI00237C84BE|nr:hypothetical protein [Xenorhabdus bovienii]MDE1486079.1 hypothetical protein [Xenorhabdus bovienii]MDE9478816.1 hypothetical protein [Xenorhabdus bovienii]MDE9518974.1 hypothetical protein [Xenorhabdus bovienii]MDE9531722.1 hypothetical protein [Xenorhabdus bovienii]MDE9539793.1 hypothetical protein [Xenorhabdus bovienii]
MSSKLEAALMKYLNGNLELKAGIFESATYPDGTPVATVGYINEYGASIEVPAKTTTIYRKMNADGSFAGKGKFVKAAKSNFATTHAVPAHTINIPPRPFFRTVVANGKQEWSAILAKDIRRGDGDTRKAMGRLGEHITDELQKSVLSWAAPPNSPSTAAKKGFNKPLVDTAQLSRSFGYEVNDD